MSEPIAQPKSAGELLVKLADQKPPPDFWDELKKKAKAWGKKWAIRLGGTCVFAGSNYVSYSYGKGADLSWLLNIVTAVAVGFIVVSMLGKVK